MTNVKQEKSNKKTFGDWIVSLLEAHLRDIRDEDKRYRNIDLKQEISLIGNDYKWARHLHGEFAQIEYELKRKVLTCPHDQEDKKSKTENWEQCEMCGCARSHKYNEHNFTATYYERSSEIMKLHKDALTSEEHKILDDFCERNIGDMTDRNKWNLYDSKMKEIFTKYPIWEDWEF